MAKALSDLLDAREPQFAMAIHHMEQATGNGSIDVRLTAELVSKTHQKMRALGLDPKDTTGKELYQALFNLVKLHDKFLSKRIGLDGKTATATEIFTAIQQAILGLDTPKHAWVLKQSVAKRLLKATPPKRVMKQLGYRSIDSMLKRENIMEVFGAIRFLETAEWQRAFVQKYKKLSPTDFEVRDVEIIVLDPKRWAVMADHAHAKKHNISHLKELGAVVVLPLPVEKLPGLAIITFAMLVHYINEIRLYSAYFKMQQVRADFAELLVTMLLEDPRNHVEMAGQPIHWRVIHQYYGRNKADQHPEIFEPHVTPEDLHWRRAEEVLYRLEPALHFWHEMDYVGVMHDGRPVSFNLLDMAVSYVNGLKYGEQAVYHMRESLWNEIYIRYMGHPILEQQVLKQLDNERVEPDHMSVEISALFD